MSAINVIAHNLPAMFTDRQLNLTVKSRAKSAEKLGSGYRINRAADDASGLSISEKMRSKIRGLNQGTENTQDAISFIQIGDGAMTEINDMLHRMTELSVKAANGTMSESDRADCDNEIQQLKNDINRISTATKFNTIPIFESPEPGKMARLSVEGVPDDLQVYNATYDDATGKVTYGGVSFHERRIAWDDIDPNMVYTDSEGVQRFHGGYWKYTISDDTRSDDYNGTYFHLMTNEGDTVPKFTRDLDIRADREGIYVDGEKIDWSDLKNEYGDPASDATASKGFWTMDYHGAEVTIEFLNVGSIDDMAESINNMYDEKNIYDWYTPVTGSKSETAVKAAGFSNIHMTQNVADILSGGNRLMIHADDNGVWLENSSAPGTKISGSEMSWDDMGLSDWFSGYDVKPDVLAYTWVEDDSSSDKTGDNWNILHFDYSLSEVTSKNSVIDGLDGMEITSSGIVVGTGTYASKKGSADSHIKNVSMVSHKFPTFNQEYSMGRDYNTGYDPSNYRIGTASYDSTNNRFRVTVGSADGDIVLNSSNNANNGFRNDINTYLNGLISEKRNRAVAGDTDTHSTHTAVEERSFNVSLSNAVNSMTLNYKYDITDTQTCFTAGMREAGSGTYVKLDDGSYASGRQFYARLNASNPPASVMTGAVNATALSELYTRDGSDNYSKYSAPAFYTYDSGTDSYVSAPDPADLNELKTGGYFIKDGDEYKAYNTSSGMPSAFYRLDSSKIYNGADSNRYYKISSVPADGNVYYNDGAGVFKQSKVYEVYFQDEDGNTYRDDTTGRNSLSNFLSGKAEEYRDTASARLANATDINIKIDNYTTMNEGYSANANSAVRPTFETVVTKDPNRRTYDGVVIQHSNSTSDHTAIPRFGMNTFSMGILNAGCRTEKSALMTIDLVKEASAYVASCRSTYGAMQNRYEHAIKINQNSAENITAAESLIRDTDMAKEMVKYSNESIIEQAGQSMLTQANRSRDYIVSLLQ